MPPGHASHGGDVSPETTAYTATQNLALDNASTVDAFAGPDAADRSAAFIGLNAVERFVQSLYLDELGRAGAKAELDGWAAVFNSGGAQQQEQATIASGIGHSLEARDYLVKSWYLGFLGRPAQGCEKQGFVAWLQQGASEEHVLGLILGGGEFYARAQTLIATGTADDRYVQALYLVLLNRTASSAEVAGFTGAIGRVGRTNVALAFLQSEEFRSYDVEGYYNALLHRPSDATGLNGWVFSNLDVNSVRIGFESSPEYFANG